MDEQFYYGLVVGIVVTIVLMVVLEWLARPRPFTNADLPKSLREYRERKEIH